ncbi:MAG: hypothetical protein QNK75_09855 [Crocinitomicaceae bacterium]
MLNTADNSANTLNLFSVFRKYCRTKGLMPRADADSVGHPMH